MNLSEIIQKLEEFIKEVERVKSIFYPSSNLSILIRRINFIKIRLELENDIFLDMYYNAENERKDFAVIFKGKRILGYDNLGEWHKHPFYNPDLHLNCNKPLIDEIFKEISEVLKELRNKRKE